MSELIRILYNYCCPTYIDNSGARSRDGCRMCWYCDANLDCKETHAGYCPWLVIEREGEKLNG